ncbi:MAG: CobD/CbiB family protein [Betaproteobacteria bacterium]|nr:CobD/CbiB family protein [Betaproteobacteria bacterium]
MALFSIVIALILEQVQPLAQRRFVLAPLSRYAHFLAERFNDGQRRHGRIAWLIAVLPGVTLVLALQILLDWLQPSLGFLFGVAALYLTMGFRQFSHHFTDIHLSLRMGELERARALLGEWRGRTSEHLSAQEVARLAIEEALVASHHYVFAPLLCFVLFGPAGAVLYRLALFFKEQWGPPEAGAFGEMARSAFAFIDWLPLRVSAGAFAIVGDFEDAVYCWRTQSAGWPDGSSGILLASGAGALGVRLGATLHEAGVLNERPELGLGEEADVDFMQSTIGLVWRTLVLCLLLLALLWVASWVG